MAIVTGYLYKGFTFGDIQSKAYGVYITQEAAYNAPDRDVEVVEIAGRNGAYILDKGRFKNITVSYKCGIALDDEQRFESAIRTFRNALASKAGKYVRLTDEYNPNEFRQAAFLGGIEVEMSDRRAGEFTVSFDCMPQRFLKSGETAVSVASGGTITNPTPFDASPLLHAWGYGDIVINGEILTINNDQYGQTLLANKITSNTGTTAETMISPSTMSILNANDSIYISSGSIIVDDLIHTAAGSTSVSITSINITQGSRHDIDGITFSSSKNGYRAKITYTLPVIGPFSYNQNLQQFISAVNVTINYTEGGTAKTSNATYSIIAQYRYDPYYDKYRISLHRRYDSGDGAFNSTGITITEQSIYGFSTQRPFADDADFYFDLDIGEAYKIEDGETVSVNNAVTIPAELPVLKAGGNEISYDNTISQLEVFPRWWEV